MALDLLTVTPAHFHRVFYYWFINIFITHLGKQEVAVAGTPFFSFCSALAVYFIYLFLVYFTVVQCQISIFILLAIYLFVYFSSSNWEQLNLPVGASPWDRPRRSVPVKRSFGDKSINSLCGWNFRKRPPSLLILGGHLADIPWLWYKKTLREIFFNHWKRAPWTLRSCSVGDKKALKYSPFDS